MVSVPAAAGLHTPPQSLRPYVDLQADDCLGNFEPARLRLAGNTLAERVDLIRCPLPSLLRSNLSCARHICMIHRVVDYSSKLSTFEH